MRALGWILFFPLACGSHADDEIPEELLDAIRDGNLGNDEDYPEGPTGSESGDLAPNVCVEGWRNPKAEEFEQAEMEQLCFSDFWDPERTSHRLLLVNTAAIWCSACQVEYQGTGSRPSLSEEVEARREAGLRVMGTLFQDASLNPAQPEHGVEWARAFDVDFPFGIDPEFRMGAFANADVQPFNLVIDTETMQILFEIQGDNPDELWPAIDERLAAE
jgi:hypothetical protein